MNDAAIGHNTYSQETAEGFVKRYHALLDELDEVKQKYKDDVDALLQEAEEESGIPKKVLRLVVKEQRQDRKRDEKRANMKPAHREELELLEAALGDYITTELGRAASAA